MSLKNNVTEFEHGNKMQMANAGPTQKRPKKVTFKEKTSIMTLLSDKKLFNLSSGAVKYMGWKHLIGISYIAHIPLNLWFAHVFLIAKWGSVYLMPHYSHGFFSKLIPSKVTVILANTLIYMLFSVPLYMIYSFIAQYIKHSYIRYWDKFPLLKGVAYSIALNYILLHYLDVSVSGMALLYLYELLKMNLPWRKCEFEGHSENCLEISKTNQSQHNLKCSRDKLGANTAKYSTMDFYMSHMLKLGYNDIPTQEGFVQNWIISVMIVWILICIFTILGINRYRKIVYVINISVLYIFLVVGVLTLYFGTSYSCVLTLHSELNSLAKPSFWMETTFVCLLNELPGELIALAAISSSQSGTFTESAPIYAIKALFISTLTAWVSICVNSVQYHYNIKDVWCIRITGDLLIFSLMPDTFQRWTFGPIWLILYYLIIFYWGFAVGLFICNSFLDALYEEMPVLKNATVLISIGFCFITCATNLMLLKPNFFVVFMELFRHALMPAKAVLVFCSLMGLLFYTISRIKTDYYVNYGRILSVYCVRGTKLAIIVLGALSIGSFAYFWGTSTKRVGIVLLIAPVFLGMIIVVWQFLAKKRPTLISSDPSWGSPDMNIRIARKRYDPTYDLRHGSHGCRHVCVKRSTRLKLEISYYNKITDEYVDRSPEEKIE